MRSFRKIGIICLLAVFLTVATGPVIGYSWTHDDDFGRNYDPGINRIARDGDRAYYYNGDRPYPPYGAGYGPPPPPPPGPPVPYYAPPPAYYGPPVSFVVPLPFIGLGFWGGGHHHHHRHWR